MSGYSRASLGSQQYVAAIDQGSTSTRVIVFDRRGANVAEHRVEHQQIWPQPGWTEHNPSEIWANTVECIEQTLQKCASLGITAGEIKAVGVTNQRETTVVWDKFTGQPLHNAIVWLDTRTSALCHELAERHTGTTEPGKHRYLPRCGLPLSTYFSAMKLRWLLDNVPKVRQAVQDGRALFGTIDSWLIWNLTGGPNGGLHMTDVTNASRTFLMNIHTMQWDAFICNDLGIPLSILPAIRSSSEPYGRIAHGPLAGLPIAGCLGDQQAACLGHGCTRRGEAKATFGTGCFVLLNVGAKPVLSTHGLLATVAFKLGNEPAQYALEGSIAMAGAAVSWLKDNLGIVQSTSDVELLASTVKDTGDVYFVPAFSGLFAPQWREDARGVIVGLTHFSNKGHIARAVLESVCYQTREVVEAMLLDSGVQLSGLKVDGGMSTNNLCMQLQADILGVPVDRPSMTELSALGVAYAAGRAVAFWLNDEEFAHRDPDATMARFAPHMEHEREPRFRRWKQAVERSYNWV